jgi:hypothetical protein
MNFESNSTEHLNLFFFLFKYLELFLIYKKHISFLISRNTTLVVKIHDLTKKKKNVNRGTKTWTDGPIFY